MTAAPKLDDLTASNVVIVAGKGGVGKTTVTALLARAAADTGQRVLVVELDGKPALTELLPDIEVRSIEPATALTDYLVDHDFGRLARRFGGAIDVVSAATPGINDVVVLGRVKQLERDGAYDTIVVDGPAAGHAVSFLTSAAGLLDTATSGPVNRQANEVHELLTDAERCRVVLVTLPETTPVTELIETAFHVEETAGVALAAAIINQFDPAAPLPTELPVGLTDAARDAAEYRRVRQRLQSAAVDRLIAELPLPLFTVDALPVAGLDAANIAELATRVGVVSR